MAFAQFMNSVFGRVLRAVVGLSMILAAMRVGGALGLSLAAAGAVPLSAGLFDFCLLAPFLSVPWSGAKIRALRATEG